MSEQTKSKEKFDLYQVVTDQIIEAMERGVCPWKQPWKAIGGTPRNIHGRRYRGINAFLLAMQSALSNWTHPVFLTFNQAKELGGTVHKGERSSLVVFFKVMVPREYADNPQACPADERKWLLRYYRVFNVAQVDGLPPQALPVIPESDLSPIEECEAIVAGMPQRPVIRESGQGAYYIPATDEVFMPPLRAFVSAETYHSTLFHELSHSTGAESRLARPEAFAGRFGSDPYAKEELVAELGAAFLCARAGIAPATLEDSAAYLANWLKKLREDKRLIFTAASAAQRAADFIAPDALDDEDAGEPEETQTAGLAA
jgi:antirestriction protein ArdC